MWSAKAHVTTRPHKVISPAIHNTLALGSVSGSGATALTPRAGLLLAVGLVLWLAVGCRLVGFLRTRATCCTGRVKAARDKPGMVGSVVATCYGGDPLYLSHTTIGR
ncbi:hypothetical protein C7974DRAFT_381507 [Boeremia exigua]|uniref:uncharacterized protein n=1 Tax=Boeremia exigua TaxID=749465 RepID=UPI001E8CC53E|nr:uncharacterized protein C7974DRAFT_381507 [Boeremia exigua]KAH6612068.1 hypothetical protein C7974DRAFT_381507 [Boeremia exigua]